MSGLVVKLTAVTMSARGKKIQVFLNLPVIDGKTVLTHRVADEMAKTLGCQRGGTYSIG